jgi:hypothetical protein
MFCLLNFDTNVRVVVVFLLFLFACFETKFQYVTQAGLELDK